MKKLIVLLVVFIVALLFLPGFIEKTATSSLSSRYLIMTVTQVTDPKRIERNGFETTIQTVTGIMLASDEKVTVEHEIGLTNQKGREITKGKQLVLIKTGNEYSIFDISRIRTILFVTVLFAGIVLVTSGKKGALSLVGIGIGLLIIFFFIAPRILNGENPVITAIIGTIGILTSTMFLSHGINKKSISAFIATVISLVLAGMLSYISIIFASLSGLAVDQATYLNVAGYNIQLQGLLLAGIIISLLGILDDVTITQASIVETLFKSHPKMQRKKLFLESFNVGRDHIASIVNTLVLVYAGVSLPLFLIIIINPSNQPLWVLLNGEVITTEIIRTLCASIGIVLAVPIATLLSVYIYTSRIFSRKKA